MTVDLARWQFAFVTINHFFFVPITIGLAFLTALVSSTNPAYNLTAHNTASGPYTLKVMTIVAIVLLPLVLLYQAWTYYVFRKRVSREEFLPPARPAPEPAASTDATIRLPVGEAGGKGP